MTPDPDYRAAWNHLIGGMRILLRSDLYVKDAAARATFRNCVEAAWHYGQLPVEAGLKKDERNG